MGQPSSFLNRITHPLAVDADIADIRSLLMPAISVPASFESKSRHIVSSLSEWKTQPRAVAALRAMRL
jgi:hypothetical protein